MTTTAAKVPYVDASPAELREAILPEDRDQFDASFRRALDAMADSLSLEPLQQFLEHWRRIAWSAHAYGHDSWRQVLARAEYTLATGGERPPFDATAGEIRQLLRERQAR